MTGVGTTAQALTRLLSIFELRTKTEICDRVADMLAEHLDADAVALVEDGVLVAQTGCGRREHEMVLAVANQRVSEDSSEAPHLLHFPIGDSGHCALVALRAGRDFSAAENMAARAMIRMMSAAVKTADAVADERDTASRLSEQLDENRSLSDQLSQRQTALAERLAEIQELVATRDLTDEALPSIIRQAGAHFPGGELVLRLTDATGAVAIHSSVGVFGRADETEQTEQTDSPRSDIAAPVFLGGEPYGELAVAYRDRPEGASDHEREAIAILAGFLSLAITEMEARREVALVLRDVEWRASHDLVTGLHNRTSFVTEMDRRLSTGQIITVIYIDLDGFKAVNDNYGHATGDRVLAETAERLRSELREGTVLARLAGDEFAILLSGSGGDAIAMAERIGNRLGQPIAGTETDSALVTASLGIAHGIPGWTAEDILDAADIAMYHSKQHERGSITVFDNSLRIARDRRIEIERRLKASIETMESFHVAYLPTTDLVTGERTSVEALLRWEDDKLGPVPTDEFIEIAEQAGLIRDLDSWVIATALADVAAHLGDSEIGISLNLSPASFEHPDLVGMLAELLVSHRIPAQRLTLEITERVLLQGIDRVVPVLDRLHGLGLRIALDDFGAGYSSFAHLQSSWIDVLKVDRVQLPTSEHDTRAISILRALRSLCAELDLDVVIEGIDSEFQRSTVRSLGFREAQGFLWGRPASLEAVLGMPDRHLRAVDAHNQSAARPGRSA